MVEISDQSTKYREVEKPEPVPEPTPEKKREYGISFVVVLMVAMLVIGFIAGSMVSGSRGGILGSSENIQIVDWSVENQSGQKLFTIKLTNLGSAIGQTNVFASVEQKIAGINERTLTANQTLKLAPSETVTIHLSISLAWSPYTYSKSGNTDYYASQGATAIPAIEVIDAYLK